MQDAKPQKKQIKTKSCSGGTRKPRDAELCEEVPVIFRCSPPANDDNEQETTVQKIKYFMDKCPLRFETVHLPQIY